MAGVRTKEDEATSEQRGKKRPASSDQQGAIEESEIRECQSRKQGAVAVTVAEAEAVTKRSETFENIKLLFLTSSYVASSLEPSNSHSRSNTIGPPEPIRRFVYKIINS